MGFDISIHLIVLGNIERNRVGTDEKTAMIVLGRAGGEVLVRVGGGGEGGSRLEPWEAEKERSSRIVGDLFRHQTRDLWKNNNFKHETQEISTNYV